MKKVIFNPTTREQLLEGVKTLSDAVGTTLGPKGNNVVIQNSFGTTLVTKDGVTVAKNIVLEDPLQNMGCDIIKQAASKTADIAGDGTTTATVLAYHLAKNGMYLAKNGISPINIKRQYELLLQEALLYLQKESKAVTPTDVINIATISANNDPELGKLIAEAVSYASSSGLVSVEESKTGETYIDTVEGSIFDRGFVSPLFINNNKNTVVLENPIFLITDKKIRTANEIVPAMEIASKEGRPLVVIADEIEAQALQLLLINKVNGRLNSVAIKAPAFGNRRQEILEDLCSLTSSTLITENRGLKLEGVTAEHLGEAGKIVVTSDETTITKPVHASDVVDRIEGIKSKLNDNPSSYDFDKLTARLSLLQGQAAVIHVGAFTETEMSEKKDRIDDALRATRAALEKGYVTGGGYTLVKIAKLLGPTDPVSEAFIEALIAPALLIRSNAGQTVRDIIEEYTFKGEFNSHTMEFSNLLEDGVIDPTLVTEQVLKNAVSAACMILLSTTAVYPIEKPYSPGNLEDYQ
jgi:chaperonin GroEL